MLGSYPVQGKFGKYGGKYIPETLAPAVSELEAAYEKFKNDPEFQPAGLRRCTLQRT
jgi:tryptophan synthase beta chain